MIPRGWSEGVGRCEEEGGENYTGEVIEVFNEGTRYSTHLGSSDKSYCMFLKLLPCYSRHVDMNERDVGQTGH